MKGKTPIKELNTNNMQLIVEQNKKLIKYCNTLRGYYIKSTKTIEKYIELQEEHIALKYENEKLKEKNHKLNLTINKIFKVILNVFKVPRESIIKELKDLIK